MRWRNLFHRRRDGKANFIDSPSAEVLPSMPAHEEYTCILLDDLIYELFEAAALVNPPRKLMVTHADAQALDTHTLLGWITLTHVCRRWRIIGHSTTLARLWARIVCLSEKPSIIEGPLLLRAGGHPIAIDLTRYDEYRPYDNNLSLLEKWALVHIDKADALIAPSDVMMRRFNQGQLVLPTLRDLHLIWEPGQSYAPITWEAPGLRYATLSMTFLPRHMSGSLRELNLHVEAGWFHLAALRDFMHSCPLLEVFDGNIVGQWATWERRPRTEIYWNYLRRAKIVVDSEQVVADVWKPVVGPPESVVSITITSRKYALLRRPQFLLEACARELDNELYDKMDISMSDSHTGRNDLRLRFYSTSAPSYCELLFPYDEMTHATMLSLLPFYIPNAAAHIGSLRLDAVMADTKLPDCESFRALGRELTGVEHLGLRGMDYRSIAMHIRMLCQTQDAPVLRALRTIRISGANRSEIRDDFRSGSEQTQSWWDTIITTLTARKEAGLENVEVLRLDGVWMNVGFWIGSGDREGRDVCTGMGLVGEIIDERVWKP